MIVLIFNKASATVRGELSRLFIEPQAGVFVGSASAGVRDQIWRRITASDDSSGCVMIHSANNEQGFAVHLTGETERIVRDFDGLALISMRHVAGSDGVQPDLEIGGEGKSREMAKTFGNSGVAKEG